MNETMYAVYGVDWYEHERGFGQRFLYTTHYLTEDIAKKAIKDHWDSLPDGEAPDTYIAPRTPKLAAVTKQEYNKLKKEIKNS